MDFRRAVANDNRSIPVHTDDNNLRGVRRYIVVAGAVGLAAFVIGPLMVGTVQDLVGHVGFVGDAFGGQGDV